MKVFKCIAITLFLSTVLFSRTGMRESTLVVKKDYGYIRYAEDFYRLYSMPMYYTDIDLLQNIDYLQTALLAPFDFANRAITIIKTEAGYKKYMDIMHMQFNYLITQNYIYLAGLYDKPNYFFYNNQFKEDIKNSFEYAIYFYKLADEQWSITKELAVSATTNRAKIEMDNLIDKAYKIRYGEIDYSKTARRQLLEIEQKLALMNNE